MKIGCVKELKQYEYRVGMTPENAKEYIRHGHAVYVETGAGEGSSFTDQEYEAVGAQVMDTAAAVWAICDLMIKVKEPLPSEYPLMKKGLLLYTYLHLAANKELTDILLHQKVTAIAYETIESPIGDLPLLKPMSAVAGRLSIQEGAKYLEKPMGGMGLLLGGVPGVRKARVLILGAGIVGMHACKMAVGLGVDVVIMDLNLARLEYLDDIFEGRVQTLYSSESAIEEEVKKADLIIGAVLIPGAAAPKLVKRSYLKTMKKGSVIVDVAVDQGGCIESSRPTYHDNPTFVEDGVIHYCVSNMPGAVSQTSTMALTNATLAYGLRLADLGFVAAVQKDPGFAKGVNCYDGKLTCSGVADSFAAPCTDIHELI